MRDLVSVIITTYKRADMLNRAIDSVLAQTYSNIEIMIIDDNDPNTVGRVSTERIMKKYSKIENIHYIKHEENKNGAAARNTGLRNSKGKYVTYLDDDDFYYPEKIEKQVKFLQKNRHYDAVYCGWLKEGRYVKPEISGDMTYELLSGEQIIITNTIMMDRKIAIEIGGWDERFTRNQEAAYLLRYFSNGYTIGVISDVLVEFDSSDSSNRSNPVKNEKDFEFYLSFHKEQISHFPKKKQSTIYCKRYLGVLLNYIKNNDYKNALRIYVSLIKKFPRRFHRVLLDYLINKF